MVEFNLEWYEKFIQSTDEKSLLASKIADLIKRKSLNSCLEIGLGTAPHFARELTQYFKRYTIVEKRLVELELPKGVEFVNSDWEHTELDERFDVIIASHVVYYFENKKAAIDKMFKALSDEGKIFFVVNGREVDYGSLKRAFAKMAGIRYKFTYDELLEYMGDREFKEYTLPSEIAFSSPGKLFETLQLTFDSYPTEYERLRKEVIQYLKENVKGNKFIIDQKIIEVGKGHF